MKTFFECLNSEYNLDLFKQEIAIGTRARHFNIVFLYGVTIVNGTPIRIVTELLEGSLSDVIEASDRCKQPLCLREQIDLASGMTAGISYLHELGHDVIFHGDIRSRNVVVSSLMEANICDLGAARFAKVLVSAGPLSPEYLAPERKGCLVHNTKMADVYSLGVTVIELMIGQHPVANRRIKQALKVTYPDVKQMCLRLIEEDPSARPGADECLAVLERIQESRAYSECVAKRMVKGAFRGEGKIGLVLGPWAQRRLVRNYLYCYFSCLPLTTTNVLFFIQRRGFTDNRLSFLDQMFETVIPILIRAFRTVPNRFLVLSSALVRFLSRRIA